MEQQNQDALRQGLLDFELVAPWARLPAEDRGAIPRKEAAREGQVFEAWKGQLDWEERLLERVANTANLEAASQRVIANKGAAGVDGMSVAALKQWVKTGLGTMREQLLGGTYRHQGVRKKSIPKPNGDERILGIPTVIDRMVQQAVLQVLTPMLDPQMSESSHGFRPGRKAHDALEAASRYVREGYKVAVDLDLAKFFDTVNHDILMERLARRIKDKRLLWYIRQMLKAGMMDNEGVCQSREQGTPQGGPLSPLLANILLDELDRELERRGLRFCRYADDCIIFVKTMEAGHRVLEAITRYIEGELRLKVNREKSKVDKVWNCVYLGYIIGAGGKLRIAPKSVEKLKAKVRLITRRGRALKLRKVIDELAPVLRGWVNYFRLAAIKKLCQAMDEWIRRRLRCYRLKQCKHPKGIRRFLESIGCKRKLRSGIVAMGCRWWHTACSQPAHIAMDNAWLQREGLVSLSQYL